GASRRLPSPPSSPKSNSGHSTPSWPSTTSAPCGFWRNANSSRPPSTIPASPAKTGSMRSSTCSRAEQYDPKFRAEERSTLTEYTSSIELICIEPIEKPGCSVYATTRVDFSRNSQNCERSHSDFILDLI